MIQDPVYTHPSLTPPPKRSLFKILAVILGSTLLGIIFLGWCGIVYYQSGKPLAVNDLDRVVVVTASDLERFLEGLVVRGDAERYRKRRYMDGHVELQYSYENPDPNIPLYISCTIQADSTLLEARETYLLQAAASRTVFKMMYEDGKFTPRNDLFEAADQSLFGVVSQGDTPLGTFFTCRRGRVTLTLQIYSPTLDQTLIYGEIATPALDQLGRFERSVFGADEEE